MNAQQCVEPTGPNRSIGLISILLLTIATREAATPSASDRSDLRERAPHAAILLQTHPFWSDDLVIIARGPTPDPIPNSAVKSLRANGTASQDAGE